MININRGETKTVFLKIRGSLSGDPHDFTGASEIVVSFPSAISKTLSGAQVTYPVSPLLGELSMVLSNADTAGLTYGQGQEVVVTETKAGVISIFKGNILNVN